MSFVARQDYGTCGRCSQGVKTGDDVKTDETGEVIHIYCDGERNAVDEVPDPYHLVLHNLTADDIDGISASERGATLTLERPVCKSCRLELPVSMICGYC